MLRTIHGFSIIGIAYFFGLERQTIREFEVFGFRIYFLLIAIILFLIYRRLHKVYKWWVELPTPEN
ncbi:MAG: hypothetical protein CL785_00670 [Chloroflexi bacterium]|nr:hypothetical protein [Chloroflexota bacterium]